MTYARHPKGQVQAEKAHAGLLSCTPTWVSAGANPLARRRAHLHHGAGVTGQKELDPGAALGGVPPLAVAIRSIDTGP